MKKIFHLILLSIFLIFVLAGIGSILHEQDFSPVISWGWGDANGSSGGGPSGPSIGSGEPGNIWGMAERTSIGDNPPHEPLFKLIGEPKYWFMRRTIGEIYENGTWKISPDAPFTSISGNALLPQPPIEGPYKIEKRKVSVRPIIPFEGFLPTFLYPTKLENFENLIFYPNRFMFYSENPQKNEYEIDYRIHHFKKQSISSIEGEDVRSEYFSLPSGATERTEQLAQEIVEGIENPYDKATAIENYLNSNYTYAENFERSPENWDPVDWFLFEEKKGMCTVFNSAFLYLARSAGLPTRMLFGFIVKQDRKDQVVYADDSHAAAEIKFEDAGWLAFDATGLREETTEDDSTTENDSNHERKSPKVEIIEADNTAIKGENLLVSGIVSDSNGLGLSGLDVLVYLKDEKGAEGTVCGSGTTRKSGFFEIECSIGEDVEVGEKYIAAYTPGNENYKSAWSDPPIRIISDTQLSLSIPNEINLDGDLEIEGKLKENTGSPVSNANVKIEVDEKENLILSTNPNGQFSENYSFSDTGKHKIKAIFEGTEYRNPSFDMDSIKVRGETFPWFFLVLLAIAVMIPTSVGLYLWKQKTSERAPSKMGAKKSGEVELSERPKLLNRKETKGEISIEFPQLEEDIPNIVGVGEEVQISLGLPQRKEIESGGNLELKAGDKTLFADSLKNQNEISLNPTFEKKGIRKIVVRFFNDFTEVKGSTRIKVVNYREEVVEQYRKFVKNLRKRGIRIENKTTARELHSKVLKGVCERKEIALELVDKFELARYSPHEIGRDDFVKMFKARKKLEDELG